MKFEEIGFNFIKQCNSSQFLTELEKYHYFTTNLNEKVDIAFLPFVDFDQRYDAIYYDGKLNGSALSYYGNAVLSDKELSNINRTLFTKRVINDYLSYLRYSSQISTPDVFNHFWQVTSSNYNIKIEPADVFKRNQ